MDNVIFVLFIYFGLVEEWGGFHIEPFARLEHGPVGFTAETPQLQLSFVCFHPFLVNTGTQPGPPSIMQFFGSTQ